MSIAWLNILLSYISAFCNVSQLGQFFWRCQCNWKLYFKFYVTSSLYFSSTIVAQKENYENLAHDGERPYVSYPWVNSFPNLFFYFRNSISLETYWFLHWPSGFNNLFTLKKNGGRCRLTFPSSLVFLKIWQFFLLKLLLQPRKEQYERLDLWLVCGHFLLFFNKSTKIAS